MYKVPWALAPFTYFPGLAYEALIRTRSRLYASDLFSRRRLSRPVISVGNITMGGAGKTPLVIHIAQILSKLGFTPVVLSRGYGRLASAEPHIVAPQQEIAEPASVLGDEPALIRLRVPQVWLGISKDRFTIARKIERQGKTLAFILDDGFQHQRLCRDLDIVIIDPSQPLLSNRVFPRGTLREPASGLRRCHIIIVNGISRPDASQSIEVELSNLRLEASIFRCEQKISSLVPFAAWQKYAAHDGCGEPIKSAYLVAALGNPVRFLRDVESLGIEVRGSRFFSDHYRLRQTDWHSCANEARTKEVQAILTTEKDAVKISRPPDFPLVVSVQSTEISESTAFELLLKRCLEGRL